MCLYKVHVTACVSVAGPFVVAWPLGEGACEPMCPAPAERIRPQVQTSPGIMLAIASQSHSEYSAHHTVEINSS